MRTTVSTWILIFISLIPFTGSALPINPVVGDISYYLRFGKMPKEGENEQLRIQTHLAYVEFLLRSKDVSQLTKPQQEKRTHTLDLLHEYWMRGIFPHNYDHKGERLPCFIDGSGNICAVGYLVEQTAGRETAETISAHHKYEHILEMKDQLIYDWVESTGLTMEELAIIQPGYSEFVGEGFAGASFRPGDNIYPKIEYGVVESSWRDGVVFGNGHYLTFDYLYHKNFAGGIRFVRPLPVNAWEKLVPIMALELEGFHYNYTWGMNTCPEVGFLYGIGGLNCRISYSYLIPTIAGKKYEAGRHDLTIGVGIVPSRLGIGTKRRDGDIKF